MGALDMVLSEMDSGGGKRMKFEQGKKVAIRLLPPYEKASVIDAKKRGAVLSRKTGVLVFHVHWFTKVVPKDKQKDEKVVYRCKNDFGQPCRFCMFANEIADTDSELAKEISRKAYVACHVYHYREGIVKTWLMGKRAVTELDRVFSESPRVNDPVDGRTLFVTMTGTSFQTQYSIIRSNKRKPIPLRQKDWEGYDILDELKGAAVVEDKVARKVLRRLFPARFGGD